MVYGRAKMTKLFMVNASYKAKDTVDAYIKLVDDMITDAKKEERLKKHECKACFYIRGRLGGAAITHRPCGICDEDQTYCIQILMCFAKIAQRNTICVNTVAAI